MRTIEHVAALAQIVGSNHVLAGGPDVASYEQGARYDNGRAAFVVRPSSTAETSAVIAYCAQHAIHLVPQSGNTGLVSGSTPDGSGEQGVLSLARLKGVAVDAANRTASVGAGVRLSALNELLEPHHLFLPIDLGADPMIGGMVATNTGGARFLRYGDVRRNVLGLEVVLSDRQGTVLDLMSGLRKNNVGPDLKQLFIGSGGAFGIVTRAVIEVHRRPSEAATALVVPRDDEAMLELLAAFEAKAGEFLTAFEGMSRGAMQAALAHAPAVRNPFPRGEVPAFAILVELTRSWVAREGEAPLSTVLETVLSELWEGDAPPLVDAFLGRGDELWSLRHAISEGLRASGALVACDLSFRRSDIPGFRRRISEVLARRYPDFRLCDFGHIGDGGLHMNVVYRPTAGIGSRPKFVEDLRELIIQEAVEGFNGSFSAEHGLGRSNVRFYERYASKPARQAAASLLAALAPVPVGAIRLDYLDESGGALSQGRSS